jgi:HAD superfamily hydrolase (TIGR01450 family)
MSTDYRALNNLLLDVDGVLWNRGAPGQGAIAFLDFLERESIHFCLLTNDCSVSKINRLKSLTQAGLMLKADQLVTAAEVTSEWLREKAIRSIMYLGAPNALPDLAKGISVLEKAPVDAVVVGDFFDYYNRDTIDKAAKAINNGAILVAMQRNARWSDGINWYVDNGFWVAGLEYVTGQQAVVTGKPHRIAYMSALARLGVKTDTLSSTFFVSDDITSDLKGAKDAGLTTVYFGSILTSSPWVDYSIGNFSALESLLMDKRNE